MSKATRFSYWFIFILLVLVAWQRMATPLITALFAFFALDRLGMVSPKKWLSITLFTVLVVAIFYAFAHFGREAIVALPRIADDSIPKVIAFAEKQGFALPFYDRKSLQKEALEGLKEHWEYLGKSARIATRELVLLIIGLVVAASMFISPQMDLERGRRRLKNNLYSLVCDEIGNRFRNFFHSRRDGAQIISAINTTLTAIFVLFVQLPYAGKC